MQATIYNAENQSHFHKSKKNSKTFQNPNRSHCNFSKTQFYQSNLNSPEELFCHMDGISARTEGFRRRVLWWWRSGVRWWIGVARRWFGVLGVIGFGWSGLLRNGDCGTEAYLLGLWVMCLCLFISPVDAIEGRRFVLCLCLFISLVDAIEGRRFVLGRWELYWGVGELGVCGFVFDGWYCGFSDWGCELKWCVGWWRFVDVEGG